MKPKIIFSYNCAVCGLPGTSSWPTRILCSKACRKARYRNLPAPEPGNRLPTAVTGAMHEHLVCYDLLKRGFPAFRACSPSCSCDLLILTEGGYARVEVRTGYKTMGGNLTYPFSRKDVGNQDAMAIVTGDGVIHYLKVTDNCPSRLTTVPMPVKKHRTRK